MCTQKKESDEMTGHEAREDMKEKKKKMCEKGKRMKREPNGGDRSR